MQQVPARLGPRHRPDGSIGRSLRWGTLQHRQWGRGGGHRTGAHPPHPSASPHAASRIGPGAPRGASLSRRCGRPVGVGFSAVPQLASLSSPSGHKQQSPGLSTSALRARNALVLEHLPLADSIASATARRLFPLVEREDLIQVAREALVRCAIPPSPAAVHQLRPTPPVPPAAAPPASLPPSSRQPRAHPR